MVARAGAALGDGQRAEAAARGVGADAEGGAEDGVVAVDEAEEVVRPGVGERDAGRQAASEVAVDGGAERPRAGQLEVAVGDLDVRQERQRGRAVDLPVEGRHRPEDGRGGAAAEDELLEGAVGGAVAREDEHGDARDVGAGVGPHHRAPVAPGVPRQPQARLEVVEVAGNAAVRGEAGIVEVRREERVLGLDEHVRMPRSLPAEAEVEGQPVVRGPGVLHEEPQLLRAELLPPELVRGHPRHRRRLQVEQHRPGDVRAGGADPGVARRPVRTGDVTVAAGREVDEAVDRVEQVTAVREPDELLRGAGPVVLDPRLEEVAAQEDRGVVENLEARVVRRVDRQEVGEPDAEAVGEVHADVGERPPPEPVELRRPRQRRPRHQRAVVPPRPIFARPLHAELVRQRVAEERAQPRVERVRPVPLDAVGRAPPRVDVEGAVHLLGPRVVVLAGELVPGVEGDVDLGEERPRVVGAADGPELVVEEARPARLQERLEPGQLGRARDAALRLPGLGRRLLVVGEEVERAVAHEGAAEGAACLVAPEVGLAAAALGRVGGRDLVPLPEVVGRPARVVRPRLRDHVDEAPGRAAELGRRALVHHHDLLDRVLVEGERGPLAAPLLAEERVVEVGPVDDDVVEDAALAGDVEDVAVRPLRYRRPRRQQGEVEVVAAVAGEPVYHLLGHPLRARHVGRRNQQRAVRRHRHRLRRHHPQIDREVEGLAHPQRRALDALDAVPAVGRHREVVGARRQERPHERAGRRRLDDGLQVGLPVQDDDHRAGHGLTERIADHAADDAGGRARLGRRERRVRPQQDHRDRHSPQGQQGELRNRASHGNAIGPGDGIGLVPRFRREPPRAKTPPRRHIHPCRSRVFRIRSGRAMGLNSIFRPVVWRQTERPFPTV